MTTNFIVTQCKSLMFPPYLEIQHFEEGDHCYWFIANIIITYLKYQTQETNLFEDVVRQLNFDIAY